MSCEYETTNLVASGKDTKTHSRSLVEWADDYENNLKKYPDVRDSEESVTRMRDDLEKYKKRHERVAVENIRKVHLDEKPAQELKEFAEELKSLHTMDEEKRKKAIA